MFFTSKKLAEKDINEKEWRIFERHFTKWLSDNSRNLSYDESKHFKNASLICLSTGLSSGFLTNLLLSRFKLIPNKVTRRLFSVFGGMYTSAFTVNSLRKNIYLKLLDSNGPAGFASRKILQSTKELDLDNANYVNPIYLPSNNAMNNNTAPYTRDGPDKYSANDQTYKYRRDPYTDHTRGSESPNTLQGGVNEGTLMRDDPYGKPSEFDFGSGAQNTTEESTYKTWDEIRNQYSNK